MRIAARSPARSIAGPEVTCMVTPSSDATIPARVVFPKPGGPANSRWSGVCSRARAASSNTPKCSFSSVWPTNSSNRRGRKPASSLSSSATSALNSSSRFRLSPRRKPSSRPHSFSFISDSSAGGPHATSLKCLQLQGRQPHDVFRPTQSPFGSVLRGHH